MSGSVRDHPAGSLSLAMSVSLPALRQAQIDAVLHTVADGNCCAVSGLSNTGKSPLLRSLARPENQARFVEYAGRPRTLLNLRALKDHSGDRLVYVTATARPLSESRAPGDNEFAELFIGYSLNLGLLPPDDAARVIQRFGGSVLPAPLTEAVLRLAGGHF